METDWIWEEGFSVENERRQHWQPDSSCERRVNGRLRTETQGAAESVPVEMTSCDMLYILSYSITVFPILSVCQHRSFLTYPCSKSLIRSTSIYSEKKVKV